MSLKIYVASPDFCVTYFKQDLMWITQRSPPGWYWFPFGERCFIEEYWNASYLLEEISVPRLSHSHTSPFPKLMTYLWLMEVEILRNFRAVASQPNLCTLLNSGNHCLLYTILYFFQYFWKQIKIDKPGSCQTQKYSDTFP